MRSQDVFGITIRSLGLWFMVHVILKLAPLFYSAIGLAWIVMEVVLSSHFCRADFTVRTTNQ